jgi:hypothetical protein
MYNFATFDTIAVRSMTIPFEQKSVIFQMQVENIGDTGIHLTRVHFHAEPAWTATSCNAFTDNEELTLFNGRLLDPREVVQTMHVLAPKTLADGEMPFTLGRVEINWVGSMGEKGSTITGVMKRKPVSQD